MDRDGSNTTIRYSDAFVRRDAKTHTFSHIETLANKYTLPFRTCRNKISAHLQFVHLQSAVVGFF